MSDPLAALLRTYTPLADLDPRETVGFDGDKAAGEQALAAVGAELSELQERLHADGVSGGRRSVLVVLQGMDTSGKGGTIRGVAGMVDPLGVRIAAFGRPTPEELEHDFLWRIGRRMPAPGQLVFFDRSHYEDVLAARVRGLADDEEIDRRYDAINDFERAYVEGGGVIVKCLLHIDRDVQADRLRARLDDPTKHWKFDPSDLDDRELWPQYLDAYETVLERCSTDVAPWFVVPSGRKWYRNWAVASLLLEHLRTLDLGWPEATFDVEAARERLDRT
ncbi:hypothetical protein GCM10009821_03810 [Aeromicrobium halocynthiae]|uniref:Polyphosphate kinase-2-related domain-containing protein n=1 Tax=Aeromicrobium halocynthiae TaxID=560557 RepID=A0ABN2VRD7_9ACTN